MAMRAFAVEIAAIPDTPENRAVNAVRLQNAVDVIGDLEAQIAGWPVVIVDMIDDAIKFYEKIRPGEVVDSLYRNILQVAYKQFRTTVDLLSQ